MYFGVMLIETKNEGRVPCHFFKVRRHFMSPTPLMYNSPNWPVFGVMCPCISKIINPFKSKLVHIAHYMRHKVHNEHVGANEK